MRTVLAPPHAQHILLSLPFSLLHVVLQAKVAQELAAATAQVSQLQLELTAHQKKEMDLRKQLSAALQEAERQETQLNKLQAQLAGKTWGAWSVRAPLCHSFSSFLSDRFFLSSGVSIPAFSGLRHEGIKKDVEGVRCLKDVSILLPLKGEWAESVNKLILSQGCHVEAISERY